jgi:sortase (surface protein transpeptidase)
MVYVKDDTGTTIPFVVREIRIYNPGYAEEVFSSNDGVHLNLVTCDGVWDGSTKSYTKRLVVFTDKAD